MYLYHKTNDTSSDVSKCSIQLAGWTGLQLKLVLLLGAQYRTEEFYLSILGSSEQNPRLVDPVEHIHVRHLMKIYIIQTEETASTENVVGLGPLLLKSFSGYPSSGGTMILHNFQVKLAWHSYTGIHVLLAHQVSGSGFRSNMKFNS